MEVRVYQADQFSSSDGRWNKELLTPLFVAVDSFDYLNVDFSSRGKRWSARLDSGEYVLITDEPTLRKVASFLRDEPNLIHFEFGGMWALAKAFSGFTKEMEDERISEFWQWVDGTVQHRPFTGFP